MSKLKTARKMFLIPTIVLVTIATILICFYQAVRNRVISVNEWSLGPNSIRGVDISAYQVDVDMLKLKEQGIQFVYIKATEGRSHVDDYFARNWQNAKDANLLAGAYHFFNFESSGIEQATNFINSVGESLEGRLLPAIDLEIYGEERPILPDRDKLSRELQSMLDALEAQYGVKPIIYAHQLLLILQIFISQSFTLKKIFMTNISRIFRNIRAGFAMSICRQSSKMVTIG